MKLFYTYYLIISIGFFCVNQGVYFIAGRRPRSERTSLIPFHNQDLQLTRTGISSSQWRKTSLIAQHVRSRIPLGVLCVRFAKAHCPIGVQEVVGQAVLAVEDPLVALVQVVLAEQETCWIHLTEMLKVAMLTTKGA